MAVEQKNVFKVIDGLLKHAKNRKSDGEISYDNYSGFIYACNLIKGEMEVKPDLDPIDDPRQTELNLS